MQLIQDHALMVSLDLLHGFLRIPVNTEHLTYLNLGFQWKGRKFVLLSPIMGSLKLPRVNDHPLCTEISQRPLTSK